MCAAFRKLTCGLPGGIPWSNENRPSSKRDWQVWKMWALAVGRGDEFYKLIEEFKKGPPTRRAGVAWSMAGAEFAKRYGLDSEDAKSVGRHLMIEGVSVVAHRDRLAAEEAIARAKEVEASLEGKEESAPAATVMPGISPEMFAGKAAAAPEVEFRWVWEHLGYGPEHVRVEDAPSATAYLLWNACLGDDSLRNEMVRLQARRVFGKITEGTQESDVSLDLVEHEKLLADFEAGLGEKGGGP